MILNIMFSVLNSLITLLFSILPTGGALPASFTTGISTLFGLIRGLSFILPLDALSVCIPLAFSWILFKFVWDFFHWLMRKIPMTNIQ